MRAFLVMLVWVAGCVAQAPSATHHRGFFATRPVRVAVAATDAKCWETMHRVRSWYEAFGVSMTLEEAGLSAITEAPRDGVVLIVWGRLSSTQEGTERGRTLRVPTLLGDIAAALVTLAPGECRDAVVAHELGHALGLKDVSEVGNLMCGSVDCLEADDHTYRLNADQLKWIRDPFTNEW